MGKTKILKRATLFSEASLLINNAQKQVMRSVNSVVVYTYYHLGRLIVEEEQRGSSRAGYAEETIPLLSKQLIRKFGRGYSASNLAQMRQFYIMYSDRYRQSKIFQTLSGKSFSDVFPLSWSHYALLCRIENSMERSFYEVECKKCNWSLRELQRQYDSALFERLSLSKNKRKVIEMSKKGQIIEKPEDVIKEPLFLEFLGLEEKAAYSESDLERAIIDRLEKFLLELGKGFLFQGRQVRLTIDGENFKVDLVLYHRLLRCFVMIDLKIGKLQHKDIGQMQMYVNYYDRFVKEKDENKTIGIILCRDRSKTMIEITLPENNKQIFAAKYKIHLPTKQDLLKVVNRAL